MTSSDKVVVIKFDGILVLAVVIPPTIFGLVVLLAAVEDIFNFLQPISPPKNIWNPMLKQNPMLKYNSIFVEASTI